MRLKSVYAGNCNAEVAREKMQMNKMQNGKPKKMAKRLLAKSPLLRPLPAVAVSTATDQPLDGTRPGHGRDPKFPDPSAPATANARSKSIKHDITCRPALDADVRAGSRRLVNCAGPGDFGLSTTDDRNPDHRPAPMRP
ncbi:uncharacterized protein CLUP02_02135 [Colletotrichum lupini]|uniref:Uncharacterized protein n=1 Tax=Colletotrichum lupini TaxID=145971 RepID=A0A9Q8SDP6_9PEZI|nr:uncharacterized protein CLUP02_02135 [Colletotrichum lupini]UQC75481.1 hypothetical protein CLUP02_02135 [Colletotrichum lupini]